MGRVVALDHGTVRIGVAVSDPVGITAQPVGVVPAGPGRMTALRNLIADWDVEEIVVGLPLGLDGGDGPAARAARRFASEVEREFGITTRLHDERFSTVIADRAMIAGGARRSRRRDRRDGVAAAVFLQGYLDARR